MVWSAFQRSRFVPLFSMVACIPVSASTPASDACVSSGPGGSLVTRMTMPPNLRTRSTSFWKRTSGTTTLVPGGSARYHASKWSFQNVSRIMRRPKSVPSICIICRGVCESSPEKTSCLEQVCRRRVLADAFLPCDTYQCDFFHGQVRGLSTRKFLNLSVYECLCSYKHPGEERGEP